MILALLLAGAVPDTAIESERAFAAMAQTEGQWTAFRAFAAPDGVMFVPKQVDARQWLKDRPDPPQAVMWWPAKAFVSCDGSITITTGPWLREGGRLAGYFTTVWGRQQDGGWKWLLDHGDTLDRPRPAGDAPEIRRASCRRLPAPQSAEAEQGFETGRSADGSLRWRWRVYEDGARMVWAELWDGQAYKLVLENKVETPRR